MTGVLTSGVFERILGVWNPSTRTNVQPQSPQRTDYAGMADGSCVALVELQEMAR